MMFIYLFVICVEALSGLCKNHKIHFHNNDLIFPSTVKEATYRHDMTFYPPAYYYRTDSLSYEMILGIKEISGDNEDSRQPIEALFPREVHSYICRLKATENSYDSLKTDLENKYGSKFKMTRGMKYIPEGLTERHKKLLEPSLPFESLLMKVDECLTIGIRSSQSDIFGKSVTVQFMYDLPLGKIGSQMDSY